MAVVNVNGISGINSITAQSNTLDFYNSAGNTLSIGASLTGDVTGNVTGNINSSGVSTLGNTVVGGGTTQLVVTGNARITGILTIGTDSITLDGSNNQVNVGTGVTLHHTNGVQVGGNTLHSTVLTVNQINASGVITATTFSGALTGNATGLSGTPNITVGTIGATSLNASGVITATTFSGALTGNVTGNATGLSGTPNITVGTIGATSLNASGVVTATSFSGSGANLTGIAATTDVRTNSLVVSGVSTLTTLRATSIVGVTTAGITTAYIGSVNDDALSGARNRIINGDMRIDQRNAGASVSLSNSNANTVDRYLCMFQGGATGTLTFQRDTVAPPGFTNSLKATVTVADTTNTQAYIGQFIEGHNLSDLSFGTANAKTVTLSFWVRSSITGTYCGGITGGGSSGNQVGYVFEYSISSANSWEYKTVTIPGETSGSYSFDTTNNTAIRLKFDLGTKGSTFTAAPNAWTAGLKYSSTTVGVVRWKETLNATFYITGVQLEPGTVATPFERRSFGQELALCQRYYFSSWGMERLSLSASEEYQTMGAKHRLADSNASFKAAYFSFPVPMRADPSLTVYNGTTSGQYYLQNNDGTAGTAVGQAYNVTPYGFLPGNYNGTSIGTLGASIAVSFKIEGAAELY